MPFLNASRPDDEIGKLSHPVTDRSNSPSFGGSGVKLGGTDLKQQVWSPQGRGLSTPVCYRYTPGNSVVCLSSRNCTSNGRSGGDVIACFIKVGFTQSRDSQGRVWCLVNVDVLTL